MDNGDEADPARRTARWTLAGVLAAAFGFPAAGTLFLATILSTNACGPFADGCDDYGKPAPGFAPFAVLTLVALVIAVAGLVVAVVSATRSSPPR